MRTEHIEPSLHSVSIFTVLSQTFCWHDQSDLLTVWEQDRMFLRCQKCGHETAGWSLDAQPPVRRF